MLTKSVGQKGIELVERTLAYPPERRIAAEEALDSEWLRPESGGAAGLKTGEGRTTIQRIVVSVDFGMFPLRYKAGKKKNPDTKSKERPSRP